MWFYLPFALTNLIAKKYLDNFILLSAGTYLLSKTKITIEEIELADALLNEFADSFEHLYGKDSITLNIHMLRHYANAVKLRGPLWSQSMMPFETNIGYHKQNVNGPTDGISLAIP